MNNLDKINSFVDDKKNTTIILPKISEEVVIFYKFLIQEVLKSKNFLCKKIEGYKDINELTAPSLFAEKEAYVIDIGTAKNALKDLSEVKDNSLKFFIFVNYSSYKKNSLKSIQLNAYDYKKDISSFLHQYSNFQSVDDATKSSFLNFSYENPHLFFSELQKLQTHTFLFDAAKNYENDTILSIRKKIFKYKNEFSIEILPKLYGLFKKEVNIKRFNF